MFFKFSKLQNYNVDEVEKKKFQMSKYQKLKLKN